MTPFLTLLAAGAVVAFLLMFLIWLLAILLKNAGVVDIAWSLGLALLALLYLALTETPSSNGVILCGMMVLWGLRLGIHLWTRVQREHPREDGRYTQLRRQFPQNTNLVLLAFFQAQALLLVLLSIPLAFLLSFPSNIGFFEIAGILLGVIALTGEAVADRQLARFKANPANAKRACRDGLWAWSRHPNYFFEWLIWMAYFVYACGTPWGWLSLYCPLLMLFFLFRVTGIPATEAQALRSRGEDYRNYQQTTSVFFPWPPKAKVS